MPAIIRTRLTQKGMKNTESKSITLKQILNTIIFILHALRVKYQLENQAPNGTQYQDKNNNKNSVKDKCVTENK